VSWLLLETELATRTAAEFRLEVIQMVANHVEAKPEFVRAVRPAHVIAVGVSFIGTERGIQVFVWPMELYVVKSNCGRPLWLRSGPFVPGIPNTSVPKFLAKVRALDVLAHASVAHVAIDDDIRRKNPSVPNCGELLNVWPTPGSPPIPPPTAAPSSGGAVTLASSRLYLPRSCAFRNG